MIAKGTENLTASHGFVGQHDFDKLTIRFVKLEETYFLGEFQIYLHFVQGLFVCK